MNFSDLTQNLLSPPVLFFALGIAAARLRSELDLPAPLPKALSLFLLFALGFKGGMSLCHSGLGLHVIVQLIAAIGAAAAIPCWVFFALRHRLGQANAAGVAATYGSVSAVTFITATAFLTARGVEYSGHMVAAMALMESPAIVIAVILARRGAGGLDWRHLGRDAFLNTSVFLLLGSMVVGLLSGTVRGGPVKAGIDLLFPAILALFLLDLGLVAGRRLDEFRALGSRLMAFGVLAPVVNGLLGLLLAQLLRLDAGDAFLFVVLCASASYIAVPAALRTSLPEANPGIYVTLSLAVTFPFNIVIGLPVAFHVVNWLAAR